MYLLPSLVKIPWQLLRLSSRNKNMGVSRADNSTKTWRNLPFSNPNPDLFQINACTYYQVWLKSLDNYSGYHPETKIWACLGQITLPKLDEIYPLAISNQISTISMHITKFGENSWSLLVIIRKWKLGVPRADNCQNLTKFAHQQSQSQISTIFMHIPSLVNIYWCLLKLSSGNEIRMDDWWTSNEKP